MKKTNKIIALILAMVLAFSSVPLMASAAAIDDKVDTVEKLIQGESLGNLVEWLLKNLNNRKEEILGSVLSLVFMFVEDEALQAKVGDTDLLAADDEALSKILVDWLNADILPGLQNDLASDDTVKTILKIVSIDISSVDNIIKTLYGLATTNGLGDISNLKEDSLVFEKKGLRTTLVTVANSGNKGVLYSVLQFLSDNTTLFKNVLSGKVKLGLLGALNGLINDLITDYISPDAIKKMICDEIELNYEEYKSFTADQLVAVAFLKLLTGAEKIEQADADEVMNLTIYGFLDKYAGQIYKTLLVGPLNNDVKTMLVENVKPLDDEYNNILDEVFNWDYNFTGTEFDEVLAAGTGNMVAKLNDAVITLLKVILTEDAFKALDLKTGGNENLDANLTKTFRFILPKLAKIDASKLGADLSGFTADKVKNMTSEEMAVAVLKLFFEGWFKNEDMAEVNKAKTLEQLAVLAAKYAVTYDEWVPMDIKAADKAKNVDKMDEATCLDLVFEIGMEVAAKALAHNSGTTYYTLPDDTSAWTGKDYLDDIVDWALNFVDGLPASADLLSTERGKLDGEGGFFKLNVILDSLFDLSFISGCGNDQFAFDFETMLLDKFLGNLLNFDIKAAVDMLAENEESSLFDKKVNKAVIDLVDDLLTGLFEESYELPATFTLGDVDADGEIKAGDARLALRASVDLEKLTDAQFKAADVDKDGIIKAGDARLILRASVGLETL
ncbi:MAG: dockerin type I repeat-containing protein [Clostridia bacterium]|nr:dockerin type I repeat-containing protein [Clostridia bacterium]